LRSPRSRPLMPRSSSISGQGIPCPAAAGCRFARFTGDARCRRGNHDRGALILRPSHSVTVRASSVTFTSATRASRTGAEILIPCMLFPFPWQREWFLRAWEPDIPHDRNRFQPEFYRISVLVDMDMHRLRSFIAEEIEAVTTPAQDGWHC